MTYILIMIIFFFSFWAVGWWGVFNLTHYVLHTVRGYGTESRYL